MLKLKDIENKIIKVQNKQTLKTNSKIIHNLQANKHWFCCCYFLNS